MNRFSLALATAVAITSYVDISCIEQGAQGVCELKPGHLTLPVISALAARESQITGIIDPETLTSSYYWTYVVHNSSMQQQEARIKLALPEGAAVTRATLWINGVPQEAAFNSSARVEHAYNWITRQHRDPLLVTQTSPGHILIQAAPVMPGQDMQLRLGITAMASVHGSRAQFRLPVVEQANMAIDCPENVHLESAGALFSSNSLVRIESNSGASLARGSAPASSLKGLLIETATKWGGAAMFCVRATHSTGPAYIVARVEPDASGGSQILLTKRSNAAPDLIASNGAAHRLSTLWAYAEIERLNSIGEPGQACQLANAYRVVSSVSGATVLENENDYRHENLERNIYTSLSYFPPGFVNPAARYESALPLPGPAPMHYSPVMEPVNSSPPAFVFPFGDILHSALQQSFARISSQLNRLNSVSQSSNWRGARDANLSEPSTAVSLSPEALSDSAASGYTKLCGVCAQVKLAGCFSGALGNMLASNLVGNSKKFDYLNGSGELPGSVIHAFETGSQVVSSAMSIAIISILLMANFAGSVLFFLRALSFDLDRDGWLDLTNAVLWLFAAIVVPDLSLLAFTWALVSSRVSKRRASEAIGSPSRMM